MPSPKFASVDAYLSSLEPVKEDTMRALLDGMLSRFPELHAKIAWNVPVLQRGSGYVAGVCAYKRHLTFSAWSPQVIEDFKPRLEGLVVWKNCFQVPVDWTIDWPLVEDLVRARLGELDRA